MLGWIYAIMIVAVIVAGYLIYAGAKGCIMDPIGCLLGTETVTDAKYGIIHPLGSPDGPSCPGNYEYYGGLCYNPCHDPNNDKIPWTRTAALTCARPNGQTIRDCDMSASVIPGCDGTDSGGICYTNKCPVVRGVQGKPTAINTCWWEGDGKLWTKAGWTDQAKVDADPEVPKGEIWVHEAGWTAKRGGPVTNLGFRNDFAARNVCPATHPNMVGSLCYADWKEVLKKHGVTDTIGWTFDGACIATNEAIMTDAMYGVADPPNNLPNVCKKGDYYGSACYTDSCSALDGTDGKGNKSSDTWERVAVATCAKKKIQKFTPRNYLSWRV